MPTIGSELFTKGERRYIVIDGAEIKVPWRYNRIMGVSVSGPKTIHELKKGDTVKSYTYTSKIWEGDIFYVLKSIDTNT
jgi:hypothetical protein